MGSTSSCKGRYYILTRCLTIGIQYNPEAVINHLDFYMMATTLTWIYVDRLAKTPERQYKIRGRSSFAFPILEK